MIVIVMIILRIYLIVKRKNKFINKKLKIVINKTS